MKSLKKATGWIIAGVAALLIIVTATSATTIVPAGHAGVVVTMGSVSNRVLDEGLHFKVPFVQQVVMMNNKILIYFTITANHANYHTIFLLSCLPPPCLRLLNPNFMI